MNGEEQRKQTEGLIAAINAASTVTFVSAAFLSTQVAFSIVTIAGVSHKDLLLDTPISLPILGTQTSLRKFFVLAPIAILIFHAIALIQHRILFMQAEHLNFQLKDANRVSPFRLTLQPYHYTYLVCGPRADGATSFLMWLLAASMLCVFPLGTLFTFQVAFLPVHDATVTWLHRSLVICDLALLVVLLKIPARDIRLQGRLRRIQQAISRYASSTVDLISRRLENTKPILLMQRLTQRLTAVHIAVTSTIFLALFVITIPDEWNDIATRSIPGLSVEIESSSLDRVVKAEPRFAFAPTAWLFERPQPSALPSRNLAIFETSKEKKANLGGIVLDHRPLRYANINNIDLSDSSLEHADLLGVRFENVTLSRARLDNADLRGSVIGQSNFENARLEGALLDTATLVNVNFDGANLRRVSLNNTNLYSSSFRGARFQEAHGTRTRFMSSNLDGANLSNTKLNGAEFVSAKLRATNFFRSSLVAVEFAWADAQGASFVESQLSSASFFRTNLFGADLRYTQLQGSSFKLVKVYRTDASGSKLWGADQPSKVEHEDLPFEFKLSALDLEPPTAEELTTAARASEELKAYPCVVCEQSDIKSGQFDQLNAFLNAQNREQWPSSTSRTFWAAASNYEASASFGRAALGFTPDPFRKNVAQFLGDLACLELGETLYMSPALLDRVFADHFESTQHIKFNGDKKQFLDALTKCGVHAQLSSGWKNFLRDIQVK